MVTVLSAIAALVGFGLVSAFLLLTLGFLRNKLVEEESWRNRRPQKVTNLGSVKRLSILPLIDYYTTSDDLVGEPGVAYLLSVDNKKILFDVGYNSKNEHPSALMRNMNKLQVGVGSLDSVVISHNHVDHVGGMKAKRHNTFLLSGENTDLTGVRAYVPEAMCHLTAETVVTMEPTKIAEGVATTGTIDRAIWLMGLTGEQALAINVEGKGLVLIIGTL